MSSRVIVVGSVNIDLVATADRLPAPGETVTGARFSRHHGGKGGNQAVAAARLGAETAFVGAVGDDAFGEEARAALAAEGIDLTAIRTVPGPTGVALILVDGRGENLIAVASGANALLTADDVLEAFVALAPAAGDVVLVGHEIPTGNREGDTPGGKTGRRDDDPQSCAGERARSVGLRRRRHPHAEPRRAGGSRRRGRPPDRAGGAGQRAARGRGRDAPGSQLRGRRRPSRSHRHARRGRCRRRRTRPRAPSTCRHRA